jgi:hypothetical protein
MITKIQAILCTCERCGAERVYAKDHPPIRCAKCKSAYWNVAKKVKEPDYYGQPG